MQSPAEHNDQSITAGSSRADEGRMLKVIGLGQGMRASRAGPGPGPGPASHQRQATAGECLKQQDPCNRGHHQS